MYALEIAFFAVCAFNAVVPGRWAPEWYNKLVRPLQNHFFTSHGPAIALVLYFCTGDNQWKYIPAMLLCCLLYDFGALWSAEWFNLWNTTAIALHHAGPLVAFYFQTPEQGWANAMLYFQIWWIHGFGFMRTVLLPLIGLGEIEKKSSFDLWLHRVYAAATTLAYCIYVQYIPVGYNYATVALLMQMLGRYTAAENLLKFKWMRHIEAPGVLAIFFYSFGGLKLAIPMFILYVICAYMFVDRDLGNDTCENLVLTKEISEFVRSFPDEKEALTEQKVADGTRWFDNQSGWATRFPMFRAVLRRDNDKVAQLLKEGADPNQLMADWFHSTPIGWASAGGSASTMKVLILAGANPFQKGVREGTVYWKQEHTLSFLDKLQELAKRDREIVSSVNIEFLEKPVTYGDAQKMAESKEGRLVTVEEAQLLLTHRAGTTPSDDVDTETAFCFANSGRASPATFACKIFKSNNVEDILSGEMSKEASPCSVLMWVKSEEVKEEKE